MFRESLGARVLTRKRRDPYAEVYSLDAPEVECIGKGKAHKPDGFGCKVSIAPTIKKEPRRRFAIEAVIGHLKCDARLGCDVLKGRDRDRTNVILAGAAFNGRLVLKWLRLLCARIVVGLGRPLRSLPPLRWVST